MLCVQQLAAEQIFLQIAPFWIAHTFTVCENMCCKHILCYRVVKLVSAADVFWYKL